MEHFKDHDLVSSDHPDVEIASLADKEILKFDLGSGKWKNEPDSTVDLSSIRIGNTAFATYALAKAAAVSGDTIVIPQGQLLTDVNDMFKTGVAIHLDGEINYTGGGTASRAIIDASAGEVVLTGHGTITNSRAGGGRESRTFSILTAAPALLQFKKARSVNEICLDGNGDLTVIGDLESNGNFAIQIQNNSLVFYGTAKSTASNAYSSGNSFGSIIGHGRLISTSTVAFKTAALQSENTFTGFIQGLTTAIELTGACPVVINGVIEGGVVNSGTSFNADFSSLVINGHISGAAGGKVTVSQTGTGFTVLNGRVNKPEIICSDGEIVINSDMFHTGFGSDPKPFNVTGGKCVFHGRYVNANGTTSIVSDGELHINGELTYAAVAATAAIALSSTGKLVVKGRIVNLYNNAAGNAIEIAGTSATLILNGSEVVTTHASAKDITTDSGAGNTDVHIQGSAVTNTTSVDTGIAEKVGAITRSADVI